jgi:immune inhibitor A
VRTRIGSFCIVAVVVIAVSVLPANLARAGQPPAVSPISAVDNDVLLRAAAMEQTLRASSIPERDMLDLSIRFKLAPTNAPHVARTTPMAEVIGSQQSFWVDDQVARERVQRPATLRYMTSHLYMWVEDGCSVGDEDLKRSAERFENAIYPTTRLAFGSEWNPGVDADEHISVFNGHVPGVGGYYSNTDEFSRAVNKYSNERELFYINLDNAKPGSDLYDGILAHEFQHMVHWNAERVAHRNEETWVDEGMAELSAELNGFDRMSSYGAFLAHSDTQLTDWADNPNAAASNYGAAHSFMHYLLKRFGGELIHALIVDTDTGLASLDKILRQRNRGTRPSGQPDGVTANQVFADWTVANYLGKPAIGDGRYAYRLGDLPPISSASIDYYPFEQDGRVHQYGTRYIDLRGSANPSSPDGQDVQVDFQGAPTVKLTANDPHSGRYQWWSNRGDDSDMTVTHAFDLTGLKSASLSFWTWYDIEKDWDWAYVAASTDGGQTWDTLKGAYSSNANVSGNNLGWGYTGKSGAGTDPDAAPAWVQEHVDLTPYAGKKVLLRFEYVTDDAVNRAGFCVDDIRIPELSFADDVESGDDGWAARGFVRSDNVVPEHFVVQLIEFGSQIRVRTLSQEPAPTLQQAAALPAEVAQQLRAVDHKPYDVQADDSLSKLAQRFLGDGSAGDVLVAETNAQNAVDPSYTRVGDALAIRAGTRLAVPTTDAARQELLSLRGQVQGAESGPVATSAASEPTTDTAPGGVQRIVVRSLGADLTRAVLVVSALAPVTTEVGTYHLSVKPVE